MIEVEWVWGMDVDGDEVRNLEKGKQTGVEE